ncbi:MAG: CAP domain-containing protein [Deltaproteobacteria bacterium]|nr:CAP domain-containing protein [Deltaproteobacteria bacterium]
MIRTPLNLVASFSMVLLVAACDPGEPTPPTGGGSSGGGSSGGGSSGGGSSGGGSSGGGSSGGGSSSYPEYATTILTRLNALRASGASCGGTWYGPVGAVALDDALMNAAQGHSADMAAANYFDHNSLDGRTPWDRIADAGFAGRGVSENIAAGQQTADAAFDGWVDSPGHCRNLMGRDATHMGIGYAYSAGSSYGAYWTQDFGAR